MPPRLPSQSACYRAAPSHCSALITFLIPVLQARKSSILATLSDNQGAYNKKIRRGRGPSSGKGKTSGRGQKGQKSRNSVHPKFQGGQTPVDVVHGLRGFKNQFSVEMSKVNLFKIQEWIDQRRLDPSKPITLVELVKSRCMHGIKDGVKLLAKEGQKLTMPINILVSRASASAIEQVEAVGGKVTTRYYTKHSIRRLLAGESDSSFLPLTEQAAKDAEEGAIKPFKYRLPDPTSRKDIEYYRDETHRGYLSHLLEEGEGPSLFYKSPRSGDKKKEMHKKERELSSNRVW